MKRLFVFFLSICININAQIITTVVGNGIAGNSGDGGQAILAELSTPRDVFFDNAGNMYIADFIKSNIRKVNINGIITTIAGIGTLGYSGDGGLAINAALREPTCVVTDSKGNIFIADYQNNRVRKIDTAGIITTYAGNGTQGFSGDGGPASSAQLAWPDGLCLDKFGNLYIADESNNRIRKVDTFGIITTAVGTGPSGTGSFGGDGGLAINAQLNNPIGVVFDRIGNMYIADGVNQRIRKVDTAGIITTVAGNGTAGYSGDGGSASAAELYYPYKTALDSIGNIYIADFSNSVIRVVDTSGIIRTIAGNGTTGYSGDCGLATAAQLHSTAAIAFDLNNDLYITDEANHVVRKISSQSCSSSIEDRLTKRSDVVFSPNPFSEVVTLQSQNPLDLITIYNSLGTTVWQQNCKETATQINLSSQPEGVYFVQIKNSEGTTTKKIVVQR